MLGFLFFQVFLIASSAAAPVDLQSFRTHSRLSFRVDPGVVVQWKQDKKGFRAFFEKIGLVDLGAPFGNESQWASQYGVLNDSRLAGLDFDEDNAGVTIRGKWKFPKGETAPADPQMEFFHFRKKSPPLFVVDFWLKDGPTVAEVRKIREREKKLAALRRAQELAKKRSSRRKVRKLRQIRSANVSEICQEPLVEDRNVFLPFGPAHRTVDFSRWFPKTKPDRDYKYLAPKGFGKEEDYVRLALKLFKQTKYGLVNRTLDFLDEEFPKSVFREEMQFLRANSLIRLGIDEEAFRILRNLVVQSQDSPVAIHAARFLAARAYSDGKYVLALESFLGLIRHHPGHRLRWVFHLGAAESLYALKQVDRAKSEYEWIVKHASSPASQSMAAFRLGDVFMARRQYAQALASYSKAATAFPKLAEKYPELWINRGEALYWLGQFDRSQAEFDHYLKLYPTHHLGWRASYRLGEIYGRRGKPDNLKQSRAWFLRTINEYPFSRGATLARIRVLPCDDHGGMDLATVERFVSEAVSFEGGDEVRTRRYQDYLYLNYTRYLIHQKHQKKAISVLAQTLEKSLEPKTRKILSETFKVVFRSYLKKLSKDDRKYELIAFYDLFSRRVPKEGSPIVPDVYLEVSRAASDAEMTDLALKLVSKFEKDSDHPALRMIAGTAEMDDLDRQLSVSELSFTKAKALWVKALATEEKGLTDRVKALLAKIKDESPWSYQRELILSLIQSKAKKTQEALSHAIRSRVLMSQHSERLDLQVHLWIGRLQEKLGQYTASVETLDRVLETLKAFGKEKTEKEKEITLSSSTAIGAPELGTRAEILYQKAEIFEKMKKWGDAATTYALVIEGGQKDNRTKFAYYRALSKTGDQKDQPTASAILKEIAESKQDDFWKKMAQEALEGREVGNI